MRAAGVAGEHIYGDKRTSAYMDREGLTALLGFARPGDRINVLTLDRLGRNMRETLNLVHGLTERGVFLRTLGDKLAVVPVSRGPEPAWPSRCWRCSRKWNGSTCWSAPPAPARLRKAADCRPDAGRNSTPPPQAGAARRIKEGAIPEKVAAELGVSRSTLYRELRKHREAGAAEPVVHEV